MKAIQMNKIDEVIYYEKLSNGMDVYLYPKSTCHNQYVTFTTRFGSVNASFVPKGKKKKMRLPAGIAHFLEHKVFVQKEDPQPTNFYSKTGTLCNAHTSLKNTTYDFTGPNNLKENIMYLLDYVQQPYFTDENVESEKGIITQEINMVNDRAWNIMYDKIRENGFKEDPVKESIAGTIEDIHSITKEMLYDCYNTFYHPSNMFLIVTGNFDKEEIMEAIKENQERKEFEKVEPQKKEIIKEPKNPVKKEEVIFHSTLIPKVSYNIKISLELFQDIDVRKLNLYIYILFNVLFDETSSFDEELKKQNLIHNSTMIDVLNTDNYLLVSLLNETEHYSKWLSKMKEKLKNIDIKEEELERKKKVLYSNELYIYDNIESVNQMILDNIIFNNKINDRILEMIESLHIEEFRDIIQKIDLDNFYTIVIKKK